MPPPSTGSSHDVVVRDQWSDLAAPLREGFVARRLAVTTWTANGRQQSISRRWEPLRPVVFRQRAYRRLQALLARLLTLAVDACGRRASTLGELHAAVRFPNELPLMDPDRPLLAAELTRYARPDLLIEDGRPRLLELNNCTRLGGDTLTPRLAEAFCRVWPETGFRPAPSIVSARTAALLRTVGSPGPNRPRRLLIPGFWALHDDGGRRHHVRVTETILADARRVGFEVVQADLADLRVDATGRLLATAGGTDTPVDLVLLHWGATGAARIVDAGAGFAAIRAADRAGTVRVFPRTESALLSTKTVLAWLHEDCDAGSVHPADAEVIRRHVPYTTALGGGSGPVTRGSVPGGMADGHDDVVVKPATGKSGTGVTIGHRGPRGDWLTAVLDAANEAPVVLQRRVRPDLVDMPFIDRDSGRWVSARVPLLVSPFMVDRAIASGFVRHMGPDRPDGSVIGVAHGARSNAVVLI